MLIIIFLSPRVLLRVLTGKRRHKLKGRGVLRKDTFSKVSAVLQETCTGWGSFQGLAPEGSSETSWDKGRSQQRLAVGEDCLIGTVLFVKGTQDTADTDNLTLTASSDHLVHLIG